MAVKAGINGFGRIGRLVLRAIAESGREDIEIVAINDLADVGTNAHLLKYDTIHGRFSGTVAAADGAIIVDGNRIAAFQERDPARLPWGETGVEIVLECSGVFTSREAAAKHLDGGARKVLISAPATDEDLTVVFGVNEDRIEAGHRIVSNGSCTTNCLAPVAAVLHDAIGIEHGFMTTIHSYTGDQPTLDTMHEDLHRARGAASNMIPTSTGAARAVGKVLPDLKGKLDGTAIRVPTHNVSVVDLSFVARRGTSVAEINGAIEAAAASNRLTGILAAYDEPLVSSDFNHDSHSSVFALNETKVVDGTFVRVLTWYDNEWGFSNRMADTAVAMSRAG